MTRRILVVFAALTFVAPCVALPQSVVFVVRHAERADAGMAQAAGADPDLSEVGRARAEALATVLKDARITAIYVTEYKRTRQTVEPLAKLLGLEPIVVSSKDATGLIERIKRATGNTLVVGHSNTIPALVKILAGEDVAVGDSDFDNLFVVTGGSGPSVLRLHYR